MNLVDSTFGIPVEARTVLTLLQNKPDTFWSIRTHSVIRTVPWYNGPESGYCLYWNPDWSTKTIGIIWGRDRTHPLFVDLVEFKFELNPPTVRDLAPGALLPRRMFSFPAGLEHLADFIHQSLVSFLDLEQSERMEDPYRTWVGKVFPDFQLGPRV